MILGSMGVYTRFKKNPDGFRALVELLESTPEVRRQKMIDAGMAEDAALTQRALEYIFTFEEVLALPDAELMEVLNLIPLKTLSYAIRNAPIPMKEKILKLSPIRISTELRDYFDIQVTPRDIGSAQIKMIEIARQLEHRGVIRSKRIPT